MSTPSVTVPIWSFAKRVDRRGREDSELLSVYRDHGVVPKSSRNDNFNKEGEDLSNYLYVQQGDLVLNKMKTWQGSLAVSKFEGIVSPAYFVCQLSPQVEPRFIHYLLRSEPLIAEYAKRSKGIRPNQWDLPFDEFKAIEVALPPVEGQRRIADFLDDQVARMNEAASARQHQRALIDDAIESVITDQLFRGKEAIKLKRLAHVTYGLGQPPPLWDEGIPIIRATNISGGRIDSENLIFSRLEDLPLGRAPLLQLGEILVVRSGALTGDSAIITPDWVGAAPGYDLRVTPNHHLVRSEFLAFCLLSRQIVEEMTVLSSRAAQPHLNAEELGGIGIPIVPLHKQDEIVEALAHLWKVRGSLKAEMETWQGRVEERKRALITAAVTGELDVTTARPIGMGKWVPNVGASVESPAVAQASSIGEIG